MVSLSILDVGHADTRRRQLDASTSSEPDVEVTRQDQDSINAFSRFNVRLDDLETELKAKKEERDELDELGIELELADDDEGPIMCVFQRPSSLLILQHADRLLGKPHRYKVDTSFIYMPPSQALERCETSKQKLVDRIEELEKEIEECEEGMKELKVVLYRKFGSAWPTFRESVVSPRLIIRLSPRTESINLEKGDD